MNLNLTSNTQNLVRTAHFVVDDIQAVAGLAQGKHYAPYIGLVGYNNLGDEVLYQAHQKLFPSHQLIPYRKDSVMVEQIGKTIGRPFCTHAILGGGTLINYGDIWLSKTEHLLDQGSHMFCLGTGTETSEFWGEDKTSRDLMARWVKALERFEFVGVRGPLSKVTLEKAGAKDIEITGDTALALAEDSVKARPSKGIVGLNYGDVPGNPMWGSPTQYRDELIKVAKAIVASGSNLLLLPIWEKDIPSNESFVREVNHPNCTMLSVFESYKNYADKLKDCDMFIGQKLHSTILALMNRVPSIMIEYRPKCMDFMASLGLEEYSIKTSDVKFEPFMKLYDKLQKHHEGIRRRAESRILEYKQLQFSRASQLNTLFTH